jgi:hypothetical protein
MIPLAVYYNPMGRTWSMFWTRPHYPLSHSLSAATLNVWELPPLVAEKVALLRLVELGDSMPELGTRTGEQNFVVYLPDNYQIKGLEL